MTFIYYSFSISFVLTTLIISLREFIEVFIIIGLFLGASKKLGLKKEKQIISTALLGIGISFIIIIFFYLIKEKIKLTIDKHTLESLEGYLKIFSSLFIIFIVILIHRSLHQHQLNFEIQAQSLSVFLLVVFEGIEIALFTSISSFSTNIINQLTGLFLGLISAFIVGIFSYFIYINLPLKKIIQLTEYTLIIVAILMFKEGVGEFL